MTDPIEVPDLGEQQFPVVLLITNPVDLATVQGALEMVEQLVVTGERPPSQRDGLVDLAILASVSRLRTTLTVAQITAQDR